MNNYFQITDQTGFSDRWFLKSAADAKGEQLDPEVFTYGAELKVYPPLTISLRKRGKPLDFTFADFDMPVVSKRLHETLVRLAPNDFQSFPATVDEVPGEFAIINVTRVIRCLDESKTRVVKWREEDGRLDKIGQYRQVVGLTINPTLVGNTTIFRLGGWDVAIIVSEGFKKEFEAGKFTGVRFWRV